MRCESTMILKLLNGPITAHNSIDSLDTNDEQEINNFPVEFLSTFNFSGMPPHYLKLKEGIMYTERVYIIPSKWDYVYGTRSQGFACKCPRC